MGFQITIPLFYSQIISNIIDGNKNKIFIFMGMVFVCYIAIQNLSYIEQRMNLKVAKQVNLNVKEEYIKEIFETNFYYENEENQGKIFNILMSDTIAVTTYISSIVNILSAITNICIVVVVVFSINWEMALVLCLLYPVELVISWVYNKKIKLASQKLFEKTDELCCFVKNAVGNLRDVKNQAGEGIIEKKFVELANDGRKATVEQGCIKIRQNFLVSTVKLADYFIYMYIGIILLFQGKISLGIFAAFGTYAKDLSSYINRLINIMAELQSTKVCLERLLEVHTKYEESLMDESEKIDLENINEIVLDNVTVCFDENKILSGVKCRFEKGKIYGIRGKNGTGKTSIGNLLMRNIRLANGVILYNNMNAEMISRKCLRRQISYIGANKTIYYMSLLDNICMSKQDSSFPMECVLHACKVLSLNDFIKDGQLFDGEINDNFNLSSGQIQKIQLARMFVKGGSVLIFDEALSNLDINVRKRIYQYIVETCTDKIIIIISHNPDDYSICSEIYRIEDRKLILDKADMRREIC